jgi:hypothetical protein
VIPGAGPALDSVYPWLHTSVMAAPRSVVEVIDVRDDHRRLRLSWHPELREIIVSHWRDNVCVATTPVGVKEIAGVIGLLVQALQDSAMTPPADSASRARESSGRTWRRYLVWSRRRLLAAMLRLQRDPRGAEDHETVQTAS